MSPKVAKIHAEIVRLVTMKQHVPHSLLHELIRRTKNDEQASRIGGGS